MLQDCDLVNACLESFGRELYDNNGSLHDYHETVNAIVDEKRTLRGRLTQAWDLATIWASIKPIRSHLAVPPSAVLAMFALALLWGWPVWATLTYGFPRSAASC